MNNPNCTKCIHYYITLDERFPKGCKVFEIKGKILPCIDVLRFTGFSCPVFEERNNTAQKSFKNDHKFDTLA
ncbi:MAG: hypothetical protein OCD02_06965 [Spirochaetaceae bacterium]